MEVRKDLSRPGLLVGVDFCAHALELSEQGRVVEAAHLTTCAVCVRRWRVTEAELQPWAPMGHEPAADIIPDMARAFGLSERDERYRPFYAHLARCPDCERQLARLTFDQPVFARETSVLRR